MTIVLKYALIFAVIATSNVHAQSSQPSPNARKLIEMTLPSDEIQDEIVAITINNARNRYRNVDQSQWALVTKEMREFMLFHLEGPGGVFDQLSQGYQRIFSDSELAEIVAFHESKTGIKWIRERDHALKDVLPFLQKEAVRLGPLLDAQFEVIARKHGL